MSKLLEKRKAQMKEWNDPEIEPEQKLEPNEEPLHPKELSVKARRIDRCVGGWCLTTYTILGNNIESIERSEPDLKQLAIEKFKIAAFKDWNSL